MRVPTLPPIQGVDTCGGSDTCTSNAAVKNGATIPATPEILAEVPPPSAFVSETKIMMGGKVESPLLQFKFAPVLVLKGVFSRESLSLTSQDLGGSLRVIVFFASDAAHGSAIGARAVQQLRETAIEIQMAPIRSSVHIPVATLWAHFQGGDVDKCLGELDKQANTMIDDLLWWTAAVKAARER